MKNLLLISLNFLFSLQLAQATDFKSVNEEEIARAICPRDFLNDNEKLKRAIKSLTSSSSSINENVHGVELINENPHLVLALKKLFTRQGMYHPAKFLQPQVNISEDLNVRDCQKVECVVEKVWGKERGLKILWIMLRYGFNTSEYAYDDSESPNNEELNDIITTLDLLPANAKEKLFGRNIPFLAFKEITGTLKNPGNRVLANSTIYYFDILRQDNSFIRIQSFLHELGHLYNVKLADGADWGVVSGWSWKENKLPKCSVSGYGDTSSEEDFAETFNMYRMAPEDLKASCPDKYEFMKTHVFEVTYDETRQCEFKDELGMVQATEQNRVTPTSVTTNLSSTSKTNAVSVKELSERILTALTSNARMAHSFAIDLDNQFLVQDLENGIKDFEHPLSISMKNVFHVELKYDCSIRSVSASKHYLIKDCIPVNHSTDIKKMLRIQKGIRINY